MFCSVLHIKQLYFNLLVAFNNETFFILKGVYMLFMNVVSIAICVISSPFFFLIYIYIYIYIYFT
jgi:hypothetical protein